MSRLKYDNIWEAVFPDEPEKAVDYETLSKLCLKYDLHFISTEKYRRLKKVGSMSGIDIDD